MRITGLFEGHVTPEQRTVLEMHLSKRADRWGEQHIPPAVSIDHAPGPTNLPTRTITVVEFEVSGDGVYICNVLHSAGARVLTDGTELAFDVPNVGSSEELTAPIPEQEIAVSEIENKVSENEPVKETEEPIKETEEPIKETEEVTSSTKKEKKKKEDTTIQ